jgi:outer membrane biosynthesis protein TonB
MARVAEEPTPSPGRVFVRSLRRLAIRDALATLAAAWRLAFEPASPVATSARASAAALFLSVIIVAGLGGAFAIGGALSLLGPDGATPQELAPAAAPTESPAVTIEPTPSPSPTPIATPSPSPTPSVTPSATERARTDPEDRTERETPEPEERKQEKKEKRETPEPMERDERDAKDEKDERDERDDKDEREEDD